MRRGRPRHDDILTLREWDTLTLIAEDLTNEQIALRLAISENTVKTHVASIFAKLDLNDRRAAAQWYEDHGPKPQAALTLGPMDFEPRKIAWGVKLAAGLAGGIVTLGLGLLVVGLLVMSGREGSESIAQAPDGRTGDQTIDKIIDAFLTGGTDGLRSQFRLVSARGLSADFEQLVFTTDEWTAMLAGTTRELYSVSTGDPQEGPPRDIDIVLRVTSPGGEAIPWRIAVADGQVVDLTIGRSGDLPSSYVPSVVRQLERFLVLPPHEDFPQPPPGHDLGVRTGNGDVDGLIALFEAHDGPGLLGAVSYEQVPCTSQEPLSCPRGAQPGALVEALPVRNCGAFDGLRDAMFIQEWLKDLAEKAVSIHAVTVLPSGYRPAGNHLLIIVTQEEAYRWEISALVERQGQVVGIVTPCGGENANQLYPPAAFTFPPPGEDAPTFSGHLGQLVGALQSGDAPSLSNLIDYDRLGCIVLSEGIGGPPQCRPDEAPGTQAEAIIAATCEGHYVRREDVLSMLQMLTDSPWELYAALDLGSADPGVSGFGRGRTQAIFTNDTGEFRAVAFTLSDSGITSIRFPCGPGPVNPESLFMPGRMPRFLLQPP